MIQPKSPRIAWSVYEKKANYQQGLVTYNLTHDPWKQLVRFQLNSSHCSYRIYGNELNNHLDPGPGNGYNCQYLEGRNGSDTYVLNHGYGEFNEINNFAVDDKTGALYIGLEFNDTAVYFHGKNDVVLESLSKPSSLGIRIIFLVLIISTSRLLPLIKLPLKFQKMYLLRTSSPSLALTLVTHKTLIQLKTEY